MLRPGNSESTQKWIKVEAELLIIQHVLRVAKQFDIFMMVSD